MDNYDHPFSRVSFSCFCDVGLSELVPSRLCLTRSKSGRGAAEDDVSKQSKEVWTKQYWNEETDSLETQLCRLEEHLSECHSFLVEYRSMLDARVLIS